MAMAKGKVKVALCVYVDPKVVDAAKEAGLNLSKTCENALKQAAEALRKIYADKGGFSGRAFAKQKGGGAPSGIRTRGVGSTGLHVWPPKSFITSD
jgi:Post-segregation antitoxin CcdA